MRARIEAITYERAEKMRGRSWRDDPRCPSFSDLALLRLPFVDFAGNAEIGELVVAREVAEEVVSIFTALHALRFPIRSMKPIDDFDGDDELSMAADNTSAFNFRTIPGRTVLSHHALGLAVDINPAENPMIVGDVVHPASATTYVDRAHVRPGMILEDGPVVRTFLDHGWHWGGAWPDLRDYHHFSKKPR